MVQYQLLILHLLQFCTNTHLHIVYWVWVGFVYRTFQTINTWALIPYIFSLLHALSSHVIMCGGRRCSGTCRREARIFIFHLQVYNKCIYLTVMCSAEQYTTLSLLQLMVLIFALLFLHLSFYTVSFKIHECYIISFGLIQLCLCFGY